jgi:hypothetical protein
VVGRKFDNILLEGAFVRLNGIGDLGMCTNFALKHVTCGHHFWVKRLCHRGAECNFQTEMQSSTGGECWECDPGQAPPAAIFSDGKKIEVIWGKVKKKSRNSPRITGSTHQETKK